MRNSGILKWTNKNNSKNSGKAKEEKKWLHSPETLTNNHVAYLVKFLGCTEVDQPKGIEVVKQGIQKLKFQQEMKKSEMGNKQAGKPPKAELTISVEGVAIQEPKTKKLMHEYPLHKISYCADDKAEKRFFSFIAKENENKHVCFVFVSDKLAEEITLTIGQAFELAYKKFLDSSDKEKESKKQQMVTQKRIALLEAENAELRKRLRDVANIKGQQDVQAYMHKNEITDICEVKHAASKAVEQQEKARAVAAASSSVSLSQTTPNKASTATPSKNENELINLDASTTSVTSKLDGFTLDDINDDDFNPRASDDGEDEEDAGVVSFNANQAPPSQSQPPSVPAPVMILSPPPAVPSRPVQNPANPALSDSIFSPAKVTSGGDIFGGNKNPFGGKDDPFGMAAFDSNPLNRSANVQVGVTAGGNPAGSFSFEDLDPLNKK